MKQKGLFIVLILVLFFVVGCAADLKKTTLRQGPLFEPSERDTQPLMPSTQPMRESPRPPSQVSPPPKSPLAIDIKTATYEECVKYFETMYDPEKGTGLFRMQGGLVDIVFDEKVTLADAASFAKNLGTNPAVVNIFAAFPAFAKEYDTDEKMFNGVHILRIDVSPGEEISVACEAVKEELIINAFPAATMPGTLS